MEEDRDMEATEEMKRRLKIHALVFTGEAFREPFYEGGEADRLLTALPLTCKKAVDSEIALYRFTIIADYCQYLPTVLDPFLERMITQLIDMGGKMEAPTELQTMACKFLYVLTKARGPKVVVRYFPHNVTDVELVLAMLAQPYLQQSTQVWEVRYILLLWLSVACMIPLDLERFDGDLDAANSKQPVMDRIMDIALHYLMKADKTQDAASVLLYKFLTRTDMVDKKLPGFVQWAVKNLQMTNGQHSLSIAQQHGVLNALALLFKHGRRNDMQPYAKTVLQTVLSLDAVMKDNSALYKSGVKLTQRIGLTFLKPKLPTWRYQRGSRSLAENLGKTIPSSGSVTNSSGTSSSVSGTSVSSDDEEDGEYDIPDELETILEILLNALKDDNFVVRMSAAKGIGRLTGRLPQELGNEVVSSVLEMFDLNNIDGRWHGGCLALAELCRRGLLLPERLSEVLPVVIQSLLYEEKRATNTYGSILRDAACYVCWAFARAFQPIDIQPFVSKIACGLIVTALFDREINVRKCAVAAFQENVGRQGSFPNGIDIVTTVDHFSVANRKETYLELSVYVAQFPEYTNELINHLTDKKMGHWDISIRELSAEALEMLTPKAPEYMCKTVLPQLLPLTVDEDLLTRHGAILSVGRIVHALSKVAKQQKRSLEEYIGPACVNTIKDIAGKIHEAKLFKGIEGELMKKAVCSLIEKASLSGLPFHADPVLDLWEIIMNECLTHIDPVIQGGATLAVREFYQQYYIDSDGAAIPDKQETVINHFLKELKGPTELCRIGYSQALGALPPCMLSGHVMSILHGLILSTKFTKREEKWVNGRSCALKAMTSICKTVSLQDDPKCSLSASDIEEIYSCFLSVMQDYTVDGRGEVGSIVRETSMAGIKELTSIVVNKDASLLQPQLVEDIFKKCIHQACEKKDKTRGCAGNVFIELLYHDPPVPNIPHCEALKDIFTEKAKSNIIWSSPKETFPLFAEVLKLPTYTYRVLLGFAVCEGGLTEFTCLQDYFTSISADQKEMCRIGQVLISIFKDYQKVDRVTLPMMKMLDQLLLQGCLSTLVENKDNTFGNELLTLVKSEISKSTDLKKLVASADVFCGMLLFKGEVRKKCLTSLSIFLCHRYTQLRKHSAQRLHEMIDKYDIVSGDSEDEVMLLLGETIWENNELTELKAIRNAICELLEIPIPVVVKKTQ